jgi:hypothetical protein
MLRNSALIVSNFRNCLSMPKTFPYVEGADELLQNSDARAQIMAETTPPTMEPANRAAWQLIKSLVDLSSGTWTGPLPPRISPPLMLGDCPVKHILLESFVVKIMIRGYYGLD